MSPLVSPGAEHGLDEALGFAAGLRAIGPDAQIPDPSASSATRIACLAQALALSIMTPWTVLPNWANQRQACSRKRTIAAAS